jgi:cell division protein FtsL
MATVVSGTGKGRPATHRKRRPRMRRARTSRRSVFIIAVLVMLGGLLISVRRSSEGTLLAESIGELRQEVKLLEEQLSYEIVRVDSLSSLKRIAGAAAGLGLREADDNEVLHVVDVREPQATGGGGHD